MNRALSCVLLVVAIGCASAPPKAAPISATRQVPSDVVDIRGISHGMRLDPKGAAARGLDVTQVTMPRKTHHVNPVYPDQAMNKGVQGTVTIECVIDTRGVTRDCAVTDGPLGLRDAALAAVAGWRFQPLTIAGIPKSALVQLVVAFTLV